MWLVYRRRFRVLISVRIGLLLLWKNTRSNRWAEWKKHIRLHRGVLALSHKKDSRIFACENRRILTQKPARPQSDVFFSREPIKISVIYNASTSNFVIMISIDKGIHLLYIKHTFFWCGTQAVRDWSAKPSLVGSTPIHTFSGEFLQSRRTPKG